MPSPRPTLKVASCQFDVAADIAANQAHILAQIDEAARSGARIVHFCEAALSGYAGFELVDTRGIDWRRLESATKDVCARAGERRVWVVLGSTHRLGGTHRPHNSLYVISDEGSIVDRYDKRFCTGRSDPPEMDHLNYTPGNHATTFEVDGYTCGALICYDYRFPELYRELKQLGVEVLFQSFHNARHSRAAFENENIWKDIVPATMMCRAATNHMWISATNSTARYSMWPSFFVRPDGIVAGRLSPHEPGILITEIDPAIDIWDAPGPWRERAMGGQLHSGNVVDDARSSDRTCL